MVGAHHGATAGFSYHHQHKVAPAVTAALAEVATSTNVAQRGALSGEVQSSSESWRPEFHPKDLADNLSVGETIDSHSRSSVVSQFAADSVADSEAETVKMQSLLGDSSLSVLGQQARRRTSGADDILPPPRLPITAETVRAVLRDLHQRTRLQRGFLPGSRATMQSRESVYRSLDHIQSGAGSQELTSGYDGILRQIYLLAISVFQVNSRCRESCLLAREAIQSCGRD